MKIKDIMETIEEDIFAKREDKITMKILILRKILTTIEDITTTMTMMIKMEKNTMAITEIIINKIKMKSTLMLQ